MRRRRERDAAKERMWRRLFERQRNGRLSVREFCQTAAVAESAFYFWRRELAKRDAETANEPGPSQRPTATRVGRKPRRTDFLPVVLESPSREHSSLEDAAQRIPLRAEIEIQFPDATTLRVAHGASPDLLRLVLAALRGEAC